MWVWSLSHHSWSSLYAGSLSQPNPVPVDPATLPLWISGRNSHTHFHLTSGFSVGSYYINWHRQKPGSPPQCLLYYFLDSNKHQGSLVSSQFSGSKDVSANAGVPLISEIQPEDKANYYCAIVHGHWSSYNTNSVSDNKAVRQKAPETRDMISEPHLLRSFYRYSCRGDSSVRRPVLEEGGLIHRLWCCLRQHRYPRSIPRWGNRAQLHMSQGLSKIKKNNQFKNSNPSLSLLLCLLYYSQRMFEYHSSRFNFMCKAYMLTTTLSEDRDLMGCWKPLCYQNFGPRGYTDFLCIWTNWQIVTTPSDSLSSAPTPILLLSLFPPLSGLQSLSGSSGMNSVSTLGFQINCTTMKSLNHLISALICRL